MNDVPKEEPAALKSKLRQTLLSSLIFLPVILAVVLFPWGSLLSPPAVQPVAPRTGEKDEEIELFPEDDNAKTSPSTATATSQPGEEPAAAGPTANIAALKVAAQNLADTLANAESAVTALQVHNADKAEHRLHRAAKKINESMDHIQDSAGGDVNFGQLPWSNPLRLVGSGRHNIREGKTLFLKARTNLASSAPNLEQAQADIEAGITSVQTGANKITRAIALAERASRKK